MTVPSWQPDPFHRHELRWWDGQQWTDSVSDHGAVGIDPHWAPPTVAPATPTPNHRTRSTVIVAAVVAVVALAIGGVVLLGGDDEAATATTTTTTTTAVPTTSSTTSTTSTTTTPPTTTLPVFSDADLQAAMPGAVDVPSDWSLYSEADQQHSPDADSGICLGPNSSSLALSTGSVAGIDGPTFDLPDGGWFGLEAYAFAGPEAAADFVLASVAQSDCSTPVTWDSDEATLDMFEDGFGDDAVWHLGETATATPFIGADDSLTADVLMQDVITTDVEGVTYSYRFDEYVRFEQYGNVVVLYWLDGQYGFTGFASAPGWAYEPSAEVLVAAVDAVRDGIRTALSV